MIISFSFARMWRDNASSVLLGGVVFFYLKALTGILSFIVLWLVCYFEKSASEGVLKEVKKACGKN